MTIQGSGQDCCALALGSPEPHVPWPLHIYQKLAGLVAVRPVENRSKSVMGHGRSPSRRRERGSVSQSPAALGAVSAGDKGQCHSRSKVQKGPMQGQWQMSQMGQEADIEARQSDVCFTPEADMAGGAWISALCQKQTLLMQD